MTSCTSRWSSSSSCSRAPPCSSAQVEIPDTPCQETHTRRRLARARRPAVRRHHPARQHPAARRADRPHHGQALHALRRHQEHPVASLKEPVNLYLFFSEQHRRRRFRDLKNTACACASCSKSWPRARTASSRSRSSIRSRSPRRRTAPPSSACRCSADQRRRRKTVPGPRGHQLHRRQGIHSLPRPEARRAARVRRRQADPQAVDAEEAGDRLVVVAAHAG